MKILSGPTIPTPFGGSIKLPDLETPPIELPKMPSVVQSKAIAHGLGEDAAMIVGFIPWVGDIAEDIIVDMHHAEIKKLISAEEYSRFAEFNKAFPTSVALIRAFCFGKV